MMQVFPVDISRNVSFWREPDLIENMREFRLSRRCRLDMLAASSSKRD
jgi:hypothetical protein